MPSLQERQNDRDVWMMIIVVLLVEIERIHIDAKRQSRPGPPGVERRY